jgi:2-polyprenyl-6-methoxyphenol hydroxylase-like FAD-dependent oxidoreductase
MTKVLIIGGGLAGPVTAMALRRVGIDAVVYEAHDRGADGVGAFLTLAVNGMDALRALDLDTTVLKEGFDTPRFAFYTGTGKKLAEFRNGPTRPDGTVSQTIKRADLYRALRDEAVRRGVQVEYHKRLVAAEARADGGVLARFADGSTAAGDLLVGADGLRSRTRQIIDPGAPPARYVPLLNTGGFARGVSMPGDPGVMHMIFGKRCFFSYVNTPGGEVWWFANPPRAEEPSREELAATTPQQWRALLVDLFRKDNTPAMRLINATEDIFAGWSTYDFPSVPTWHNDQMIIIGDAAHAASPASGQGASLAAEDAVTLAKCLRDAPDTPAALAAYERLRRDRVERIVAQGKKNGDDKAVGPVGRVIRDAILSIVFKRMGRSGKDPNGWMYDYQIDWDTPPERREAAASS